MPAAGHTKLTPKLMQEILKLVEAGDRPHTALGVCGVDPSSWYVWQGRARMGEEPYATFSNEVACAREKFKSRARQVIQLGDEAGVGFGPAKAMLEILGRQFPKEWAPKVSVVLEEAESIWFDELSAVCNDTDVLERVRQEQNLSPVFVALCERIARRDSEGEATGDTGQRVEAVH